MPFWWWSISISYASSRVNNMSVLENSSLCRLWRMFWTIWRSKRLICKSKYQFLFWILLLFFNHDYSWPRLSVLKRLRKSLVTSSNCVLRRAAESWRLYQAQAWICYHPSSWDRCTLPLSVSLGWGFTFPCLYADFHIWWVSFWADLPLSDLSKKSIPVILTQICLSVNIYF